MRSFGAHQRSFNTWSTKKKKKGKGLSTLHLSLSLSLSLALSLSLSLLFISLLSIFDKSLCPCDASVVSPASKFFPNSIPLLCSIAALSFSEDKAYIEMNLGDDIPITMVEQPVTASSLKEILEIPSAVRESQSLSPSQVREIRENRSVVVENQAVTPSPVRESQENPSVVRESQTVAPSPVRDTQENPSAVRESQSVNLSHVREIQENSLGLRESQSVTPSPVREIRESVTASPVRETLENRSAVSGIRTEGGELSNTSPSALNQIVLYDPDSANNRQGQKDNHTRAAPSFSTPLSSGELFGSFTVQCNNCFKWRLIPTKDKYEKIRENISQKPFVCEQACEWNRVLSCDDPTDISQDDTRLWAIDKPNIAQPPQGWERLIRLRGEGGTRFADVYYVTPSGKKLRSMVEVERYLTEHSIQGVHISQFSFQTPKPLRADYVRKRPRRTFGGLELSRPLEPAEVTPISWAPPLVVSQEEHTSSPARSSSAAESM
ncbi:putative transcription factor & chromatin remodeling CW-Zn family [Dioscorea sansibarensis]